MSEAVVSVRDRIRGKMLSADRTASKLVEWEGEKILVRQPTALAFEALEKHEGPFRKNLALIIGCAFEADANGAAVRPLLEPTDIDVLMGLAPQDPLLKLLGDTLKSLTDPKTIETDATKSA